jgi:WD40 repeat protein
VASDEIGRNPLASRVLVLSADERYLVNGTDSAFIDVFDLTASGKKAKIVGHTGFVNDIKFLPGSADFLSVSTDKTVRMNNAVTGKSSMLVALPFSLKSFDISSDGKSLIGAATTGQLVMIDLATGSYQVLHNEAPNRILSVAHHPTKQLVAVGTEVLDERGLAKRGTVKIFDLASGRFVKELTGHKAGVSDVKYSPNGLLLASAGYDRRLQMWVVGKEEELPIVMDNNNGNIWKISFSGDSNFLLASCNNNEIRVWQTDSKKLAEQICPKLTRNMAVDEWKIYVGNGVDYESTCKSLLISDF